MAEKVDDIRVNTLDVLVIERIGVFALSQRRQRSMARLQEFQQNRRLLHCRLRKVALQVLGRMRHERMWRVYREWHATRDISDSTRDGAEDLLAPPVQLRVVERVGARGGSRRDQRRR